MEVEDAVELAQMDSDLRREAASGIGRALPIVTTLLIFTALSSYCAVRSEGFISGDACIHYFAARYAFAHPGNFVDVWGRPVVTTLYAGPAWIGGREGIRVMAMLIAAGCGIVAWRIARGQGLRFPALAIIFTLGQPLLFLHSFSEMTELPFALLLGLAFLAWQEKRFWLAAVLVSWTPLARPEGFGIVAMVILGLAVRRNWKQLLVLPIPLLLWDLTGYAMSTHRHPWWRWLLDNWPYSGQSMYGRGPIWAFIIILPMVISPMVLPAMFLGIWRSLGALRRLAPAHREDDFDFDSDLPFDAGASAAARSDSPSQCAVDQQHLKLCIVLTAALPVFVLIAHSVLFWRGKMASAGEARYLIVVAPFWGVLSARGWEWAFARFQLRRPLLWAAAAVLLPPLLVNAIFPGVPIPFWHDWNSARQITAWYETSPLRKTHPKVTTSHPGVYYFLGVDPYGSPTVVDWGKDTLRKRPADTLLIWDPNFGPKNACEELTMDLAEIRRSGWVEIPTGLSLKETGDSADDHGKHESGDPERSWHVFVAP
ncbi:MAG TPA: hypothetical protein VFE47_11210 [Tepidisphaeraceae bacterium]|jgi:hypothetical protein|nr:hypothetical protein [Tepidisphaeraceae bacterium]